MPFLRISPYFVFLSTLYDTRVVAKFLHEWFAQQVYVATDNLMFVCLYVWPIGQMVQGPFERNG